MTSSALSLSTISTIERLVEEVSAHFTTPNPLARRQASHTAAVRAFSAPMSETELRAVIYDSMAAA